MTTRIPRKFRIVSVSLLVSGMLIAAISLPTRTPAERHHSPAITTVGFNTPGLSRREGRGTRPHGQFGIAVYRDGKWQHSGTLRANQNFRTHSLELGPLPAETPVRLRIRQQGGGAAHIDSVLLAGQAPVKAKGARLDKLARKDFDVIDAFGKTLEVEFAAPSKGMERATLHLTARIEAEVIGTVPFQFPPANTYRTLSPQSEFYSYRLGRNPGRLTLDGELKGERLGEPFFAEYLRVGSGHPQGTTYGWVRDDGRTLFVAIDFTADNTIDGDKDYAKVYVNTPSGLRAFKVSEPERQWGRPGFSYTDKVEYQHKVYEFAIPFAAIGLDPARPPTEPLQLAFATYGTGRPAGNFEPGVAYNAAANEFLAVMVNSDGDVVGEAVRGRRIDASGAPIGGDFAVSALNYNGNAGAPIYGPTVAYDAVNNRSLVTWMTNNPARLLTVDPADFAVSSPGPVHHGSGAGFLYGLAYDANSDTLYAAGYSTRQLFSIDRATGVGTPIGAPACCDRGGLAYDPNTDTLYGTDNNNLYTIDTTTGVSTLGNPIGIGFVRALAFDPNTDTLYGTTTVFSDQLLTINTSTGVGTVVGTLTHGNVNAIAFDSVNNVLYGVDSFTRELLTINTSTGASTAVATIGFSGMNNLTYAAGKLYSVAEVDTIAGQLVGPAGTLLAPGTLAAAPDFSGGFFISAVNGTAKGPPAVSHDPVSGRYLVVWSDDRNDLTRTHDIFGQLVNADGTLAGAPIAISTAAGNQTLPAVAADPENGRFVVAWVDNRATGDGAGVYGQLVRASDGVLLNVGTLTGGASAGVNFFVASSGQAPAIAFDPSTSSFLVTWWENPLALGADVLARRIAADGTLPAAAFSIASAGMISPNPGLAFDPVGGYFLAAWADDRNVGESLDVYGQFIHPDGTLFDQDASGTPQPTVDNFKLSPEVGATDQVAVSVAANPFCRNFLTAYEDDPSITGTIAARVNSAATSPAGVCAPNPGLLWPSGSAPAGAPYAGGTPITTATVGNTAAFNVDYYSTSNTAPVLAELWIDLDGDGQYSAPIGAAAMTGGVRGGGDFLPGARAPLAAALAGLLALALIVAWLRPRLRPAMAAFALALSLAAGGAITGCGGGGGGEGGGGEGGGGEGIAAKVTLTSTGGVTTTEQGGTVSLTVVLAAPPTADITVALSSSNTNEGTITPDSISFTSANWNQAQTVTVTGVQDFLIDGDKTYTIVTAPVVSTDSAYNGIDPPDVVLTNTDSGLQERYPLAGADAADMTYTDGKRYTVQVVIGGAARTATYGFHLSDGIRDATGDPAQAHSLVISQ